MAAEAAFGHAVGIELRKELHDQAVENIAQYRSQKDVNIVSVNVNAVDFELPEEQLVLFFFNPFGPNVMRTVVANITGSLREDLRDIWVVLFDSTCAEIVENDPHFRLVDQSKGYRMYRSNT